MPAVLFGSISTIADTSELQREAYNTAFADHGLDWRWEHDEYVALLERSGGEQRIAAQAKSRGQDVDAAAVHETKSKRFQELLAATPIKARDGVLETIRAAKGEGFQVGLVTTTSGENVTALVTALGPELTSADFDVIVDSTKVGQSKPDAAAYAFALEALGADAGDCVAIEDNLDGVTSAHAAGVAVAAFPNANTAGHDFAAADTRVDDVSLAELRTLIAAA